MDIGVKQIVFIILTIFLLKITIADPMRAKQNQSLLDKSQNSVRAAASSQ